MSKTVLDQLHKFNLSQELYNYKFIYKMTFRDRSIPKGQNQYFVVENIPTTISYGLFLNLIVQSPKFFKFAIFKNGFYRQLSVLPPSIQSHEDFLNALMCNNIIIECKDRDQYLATMEKLRRGVY
jgi:hypothetical protein